MWTVKLVAKATRQLARLPDRPREACLDLIDDLRFGDFPPETIPLRGHRTHERTKFYRGAYRMIYRIERTEQRILITHIGKRDAGTYKGFNPAYGDR